MSANFIDLTPLDRVAGHFRKVARGFSLAEIRPTLVKVEKVFVEDNRIGVLKGVDCDDQPAPRLKYRDGKGRKTSPRKVGFGKATGRLRETSLGGSKYAAARGPRLAPFGVRSRVITNYATGHGQDGRDYVVVGAWRNVVSRDNVEFLPAHFNGPTWTGRGHKALLPRYNLAGHLRAWGRDQARQIVYADVSALVTKGP
jgi:hypothetical protein